MLQQDFGACLSSNHHHLITILRRRPRAKLVCTCSCWPRSLPVNFRHRCLRWRPRQCKSRTHIGLLSQGSSARADTALVTSKSSPVLWQAHSERRRAAAASLPWPTNLHMLGYEAALLTACGVLWAPMNPLFSESMRQCFLQKRTAKMELHRRLRVAAWCTPPQLPSPVSMN